MVRYMQDSVDCTNFSHMVNVPGKGPQSVSFFCGYAPSSKYHLSSTKCGITDVIVDVAGTYPLSDVLDIETGDATPAQAPQWVKSHNQANTGYPAILYCNRSTITAVANACAAAGLQVDRDYKWWIATLDGTERVTDMTGVFAVQVWSANYFINNIDLSIVYDDSFRSEIVTQPVDPNQIKQISEDVAECRRMLGVILGWNPAATLPDGTKESVANGLTNKH